MICRNAPSSTGPLPVSCRFQLFPEEPRPRPPGRAGGEGARQAGLGVPQPPFSERGSPARRGAPVTERGLGPRRLTPALPGGPRRRRRGAAVCAAAARSPSIPSRGPLARFRPRCATEKLRLLPRPSPPGERKARGPNGRTSVSPAPRTPSAGRRESNLRNHLIRKEHDENQPFLELKGGLCF